MSPGLQARIRGKASEVHSASLELLCGLESDLAQTGAGPAFTLMLKSKSKQLRHV